METYLWPEMNEPSCEAKNTYAGPNSDGWPIRPMGAGELCHSFIWSLSIAAGCRGVQTAVTCQLCRFKDLAYDGP